MRRITTLLMGAGALALAACSGREEAGNNEAANIAAENVGADAMTGEANIVANAAEAAPVEAQRNMTEATPVAPEAPLRVAPRPNAAPKAETPARAPQPKQATPPPAPRPEPAPAPKEDCAPEHRAAGHC